MTINPYAAPVDIASLTPDLPVWTMRLTDPGPVPCVDLLCDTAWTDPAEMRSHPWSHDWFRRDRTVEVVGMRLEEYLSAHLAEIREPNAVREFGRMEFIVAWSAAHNVRTNSEATP